MNAEVNNLPDDVLAAIEADVQRYRSVRINAALRRQKQLLLPVSALVAGRRNFWKDPVAVVQRVVAGERLDEIASSLAPGFKANSLDTQLRNLAFRFRAKIPEEIRFDGELFDSLKFIKPLLEEMVHKSGIET